MDAVLQALGDSHRRTVLEILRDHPATAGELAAALPIARPGVSNHLRVLREAGVVIDRKEGRWVFYRLNPDVFDVVVRFCADAVPPGEIERVDPLTDECASPVVQNG